MIYFFLNIRNVDVRLVTVKVVLVFLIYFVGWMSRSAEANPLGYGVKKLWMVHQLFEGIHRAS